MNRCRLAVENSESQILIRNKISKFLMGRGQTSERPQQPVGCS